jgi:hypothetical protein
VNILHDDEANLHQVRKSERRHKDGGKKAETRFHRVTVAPATAAPHHRVRGQLACRKMEPGLKAEAKLAAAFTLHPGWAALAESPLAWRLAACRDKTACCPTESAGGGLLKLLQAAGRVAVAARGGINEYLKPAGKAELTAAVHAHLRDTADSWYGASPSHQVNYGGRGAGQQLWFTERGWRATQPNRLMLKLIAELPTELPAQAGSAPARDSEGSDTTDGGSSTGASSDSDGDVPGGKRRRLPDTHDDGDFGVDGQFSLLPPPPPPPPGTVPPDIDFCLLPAMSSQSHDGHGGVQQEEPPPLLAPMQEQEQAVAEVQELGATHDRIVRGPALELDARSHVEALHVDAEEPETVQPGPGPFVRPAPTVPAQPEKVAAKPRGLGLHGVRKLLAGVMSCAQAPKMRDSTRLAARSRVLKPLKPRPLEHSTAAAHECSVADGVQPLSDARRTATLKPPFAPPSSVGQQPSSCWMSGGDAAATPPATPPTTPPATPPTTPPATAAGQTDANNHAHLDKWSFRLGKPASTQHKFCDKRGGSGGHPGSANEAPECKLTPFCKLIIKLSGGHIKHPGPGACAHWSKCRLTGQAKEAVVAD